ncbi:MAG: hypothetical protein JSS91_10925 [Bacteroidetes bacterium]|nr:hypothetical protein [Bacteroidota bacterium]
MNTDFRKLFTQRDILSENNFYLIKKRKKIVLFVPDSHAEKVYSAMSAAGAGVIGKYSGCSFRTNGTGTFIPGKTADPFSGKRGKVSFEKEIKLEMECCSEKIPAIIESMLRCHPYEETAYEIYDFIKLEDKVNGKVFSFKKGIKVKNVFEKINKRITVDIPEADIKLGKLLVTDLTFNNGLSESAKYFDIKYILTIKENNFKLINLI